MSYILKHKYWSTFSYFKKQILLQNIFVSPVAQTVKNLPAMQETQVRSLRREDPPGEGNGYPLQYSWLGNLADRGTWWATIHGVAESDMTEQLTQTHTHTHTHPTSFKMLLNCLTWGLPSLSVTIQETIQIKIFLGQRMFTKYKINCSWNWCSKFAAMFSIKVDRLWSVIIRVMNF